MGVHKKPRTRHGLESVEQTMDKEIKPPLVGGEGGRGGGQGTGGTGTFRVSEGKPRCARPPRFQVGRRPLNQAVAVRPGPPDAVTFVFILTTVRRKTGRVSHVLPSFSLVFHHFFNNKPA